MKGRIVKIISNTYTVQTENNIYDCNARGKFRHEGIIPLVGDIVEFDENQNYILDILPRINYLNRPMIANIDKCIIITSVKRPDFSSFLLDKMLVNVTLANIEPVICFTKYDLLLDEEKKVIDENITYYKSIGYKVFINDDLEGLEKEMSNSLVALTGQTGAGKSTLVNKLDSSLNLKTDDISDALNRGKHTTRHVELFKVKDYFIADTPGFSALDVTEDKDNIRFAFKEFKNSECKFNDCKHIKESGCKVKEDLENRLILQSRYDSYIKMVSE